MFTDCYSYCGVHNNQCKNTHCSANPHYSAPARKVKPKGGPGAPCKKFRVNIKKGSGRKMYFQFD